MTVVLQLLIAAGKNLTSLGWKRPSHDSEEPHSEETFASLPPRPLQVPTARPSQADSHSEIDFHKEARPANRPVNKGRIVFPSD